MGSDALATLPSGWPSKWPILTRLLSRIGVRIKAIAVCVWVRYWAEEHGDVRFFQSCFLVRLVQAVSLLPLRWIGRVRVEAEELVRAAWVARLFPPASSLRRLLPALLSANPSPAFAQTPADAIRLRTGACGHTGCRGQSTRKGNQG